MRSINKIVIAVQESQSATEDELRLALISLNNLYFLMREKYSHLSKAVLDGRKYPGILAQTSECIMESSIKSNSLTPAEFLGPNNIPGTPENNRNRKMSKSIFKAATGQDIEGAGK